jgi:hypothetical protein
MSLRFRDQTDLVVAKSQTAIKPKKKEIRKSPEGRLLVQPVSPNLTDRATAYFVHHYVLAGDQETDMSVRGNHVYIPHLLGGLDLNTESSSTAAYRAFNDITFAAGLASLANSGKSDDWMKQAYGSYNSSIRQIRDALRDPNQVKANHTLAAVMLMGMFEVAVMYRCDCKVILRLFSLDHCFREQGFNDIFQSPYNCCSKIDRFTGSRTISVSRSSSIISPASTTHCIHCRILESISLSLTNSWIRS